ncbi:hypothetical protein [Nevskia sp.]|uniref:hypothetical protein n=1 Tax=Nevskia sp. TaxID=1929292 RepID=UPI0025CCA728|nr:hypothetical protein [Nevskia sp.]
MILLLKSHVRGHSRRGKNGVVFVRDYTNRVQAQIHPTAAKHDERTPDLFRKLVIHGPAAGSTITVQGLKINVENPRGSIRSKTPRSGGPAWQQTMLHHYGDFVGSKGADGDAVDVFVGPLADAPMVYVVNQHKKEGQFDEHKVLLGFPDKESALSGYLAHYPPGWNGAKSVAEMPIAAFKRWLSSGDKSKPIES